MFLFPFPVKNTATGSLSLRSLPHLQIFILFSLRILLQFLLLLPPLPVYLSLPKPLLPERLLQFSQFLLLPLLP